MKKLFSLLLALLLCCGALPLFASCRSAGPAAPGTDPAAQTDFLMGLDVLPEYRGKGLARELMRLYGIQAQVKGRLRMVLTAHEEKVGMYEKMGFTDLGISGSVWGGNPWHEMEIRLDSRI